MTGGAAGSEGGPGRSGSAGARRGCWASCSCTASPASGRTRLLGRDGSRSAHSPVVAAVCPVLRPLLLPAQPGLTRLVLLPDLSIAQIDLLLAVFCTAPQLLLAVFYCALPLGGKGGAEACRVSWEQNRQGSQKNMKRTQVEKDGLAEQASEDVLRQEDRQVGRDEAVAAEHFMRAEEFYLLLL